MKLIIPYTLIAIIVTLSFLFYKNKLHRKFMGLAPQHWNYLKKNQSAPDFRAIYVSKNQRTQRVITLSELILSKKKIILYFYPKDGTPFCTLQTKSFIKHHKELNRLGYEIIGISKDSIQKHLEIIDKYDIPFKLISDPNYKIHESYGACETSSNGKKNNYRITFIIDEKGIIVHIIKKVKITKHASQVLEYIQALNSKLKNQII